MNRFNPWRITLSFNLSEINTTGDAFFSTNNIVGDENKQTEPSIIRRYTFYCVICAK